MKGLRAAITFLAQSAGVSALCLFALWLLKLATCSEAPPHRPLAVDEPLIALVAGAAAFGELVFFVSLVRLGLTEEPKELPSKYTFVHYLIGMVIMFTLIAGSWFLSKAYWDPNGVRFQHLRK